MERPACGGRAGKGLSMQPNDSNSTEPRQSESRWVSVGSTATCKRCGRANLAWQQGKSGKWYLCVTRRTREGSLEADRRAFHQCQPSTTNLHGMEVSDADIPF